MPTETTSSAMQRQSRTAETRQVITSTAFTNALDTQKESGTADPSAFSQQSTQLSTLQVEGLSCVETAGILT
jgi:hypothetical protein